MIDASRSPRRKSQQYLMIVGLAIVIVIAAFVIWTIELHHSSPAASGGSGATHAPAAAALPKPAQTILPGGIRVSSRNPFAN